MIFQFFRQEPVNVLALQAGFPLVAVAGGALGVLREDFYDQGAGAFMARPAAIVSAYDVALSGGEPYGLWN